MGTGHNHLKADSQGVVLRKRLRELDLTCPKIKDRQNYSRHWKRRLRLCFGEGKGGRFQKGSRVLAVFWFLPGDGQSLRHVNFKKEKKTGLEILDICTSCTELYFIKIYKSCLEKL